LPVVKRVLTTRVDAQGAALAAPAAHGFKAFLAAGARLGSLVCYLINLIAEK
jgi:hypothetical protein